MIARTRFPPEPNGYLHLGHVKAMLYDFAYHPGCECILRMDDTNPETERPEFVAAIEEDVRWLGFTPVRVTATSDYFGILYDFAERLIQMGAAYIDFSSPTEIKEGRATGTSSTFREKEIEWNLAEFRKMRAGGYGAGECVLRLKIDMAHENAVMRDPIAYRVNYTPHYRTGTDWCIYPSYDYSHGIVDALEGITHSYCTSEFYIRRQLYLWSVEKLGLTPATVVEFGRLNVEGVSLSKRKIIPLVEGGILSGYDDPRLFTIRGLRRRGFTPEILKTLAGLSGMDMRDTVLSKQIILHHLRSHLFATAGRQMAVVHPLQLSVTGGADVYISQNDFREVDSPDYYRLAPGKTVRLRHGPFVAYIGHDATGVTVAITEPVNPKKIKGILHWVPVEEARPVIFELYEDIDAAAGMTRVEGVLRADLPLQGTYQFEREGYFRFDRMEGDIPVFIRVVGLNESVLKS
jgi:glutaminyl-tRNA synthetase